MDTQLQTTNEDNSQVTTMIIPSKKKDWTQIRVHKDTVIDIKSLKNHRKDSHEEVIVEALGHLKRIREFKAKKGEKNE